MLTRLRAGSSNPQDWDISSYRLARELVFFRDRILPEMAMASGSSIACLLVDRSVLSRTMVPRELGLEPVEDHLYPDEAKTGHSAVDTEKVCPDIIFNLIASKEVLLSRLDPNDPKYEFRRRLIIEKCDWYKNAIEFIPEPLRNRVVEIDSAKTPTEIHSEVCAILNAKFSNRGIDL
jgi:thymidylate kinase